jgi:hypothetical protein
MIITMILSGAVVTSCLAYAVRLLRKPAEKERNLSCH